MQGDITVAGFKISAEEWAALDEDARRELEAVLAAHRPARPQMVIHIAGGHIAEGSGPHDGEIIDLDRPEK